LESKKRIKYKKKPRTFSKKLFHKFRRFFTRLFSWESEPAEYRPFLGPDATKEQVEKQKFENTRANIRKYTKRQRKRKKSITETLKKLSREWNPFLFERKKKKEKRKIRHKRHRLKENK